MLVLRAEGQADHEWRAADSASCTSVRARACGVRLSSTVIIQIITMSRHSR